MSERQDDPPRDPGPEGAPEGSLAGEDRQLTPQSTADRDTVDVDAAKDGEPG
jgi:hypothetical protein